MLLPRWSVDVDFALKLFHKESGQYCRPKALDRVCAEFSIQHVNSADKVLFFGDELVVRRKMDSQRN